MMNAMLMALVGLVETAVKYSIGAVLIALCLFFLVAAARWALNHPHAGSSFTRSRA